jgi:enamine deaminase RidA (YjgF/YER057c/UK114 family)
MKTTIAALAALTVMSAAGAQAKAADVVRYPLPAGNTFPIARAVAVPAGYNLIFHSGYTPAPANPKAKEGTAEYWGDTKTQALSTFERMRDSLHEIGVGFGDVVKMNVFLVGDPANGGRMDFKGFMDAYTQFFGTKEQPNLPARSAVQVAGLASPGVMVEIEVVLAQKASGGGRK